MTGSKAGPQRWLPAPFCLLFTAVTWEPARPHFLSFLLPPVVTGPGCCSQPWGGILKAASPREATPLLWIAFAGPLQFGGSPRPARKQSATGCPRSWPASVRGLCLGEAVSTEPPAQQARSRQRVRRLGRVGAPSAAGAVWLLLELQGPPVAAPGTEPWTTAPKRHTQWGLTREYQEAHSFQGLMSLCTDHFCWPCYGVQTGGLSCQPCWREGGSLASLSLWSSDLSALAPEAGPGELPALPGTLSTLYLPGTCSPNRSLFPFSRLPGDSLWCGWHSQAWV